MRDNSAAKRYALGLIKTLSSQTEYEAVKAELEQFLHLLDSIGDLKAGMETLLFSKNQKKEVLDSIHQKAKFQEKTYKFLTAVLEENRLTHLDTIIRLLEQLWLERNDIEKLKVFSTIPLNTKLENKLVKKLESAFAKKIILEKEIDPSLIAGIKIQRGLVYYDFSIEGNLKKLKEALLAEGSITGINTSAVGEH